MLFNISTFLVRVCVGIITSYCIFLHIVLPTGPLRDQTIVMLANGANPTLVADTLHNYGLQTRPADLYNLKQSLKFKGKLHID